MIWRYVAGVTVSAAVVIVSSFFAIGLVVILHEVGHVVAAKLVGLKVERVGFGSGKRCHILWPRWLSFPIVFYSVLILNGAVHHDPTQYLRLSRPAKVFYTAAGRAMEVVLVTMVGLLRQVAVGKWRVDLIDLWGLPRYQTRLTWGQLTTAIIETVLVVVFSAIVIVWFSPSGDNKQIYQLLRYGREW